MNACGWLWFRKVLLAGNLLAPLFLVAMVVGGHPWLGLGIWLTLYLALHWAIFRPTSPWLGPVMTRFEPSVDRPQEIWLTLDDGPDPEDTPLVLDLLKAHDAKATFFFIGAKALQHPELVRRAAEEGHGVGHHTFSHPAHCFWLHGPGATDRELRAGRQAVATAAGLDPAHAMPFRAPSGLKGPFLHALLLPGEPLVAWTARAFDTVCRQPDTVIQRLLKDIQPGAILLMHEGVIADDGSRLAPQVLEKLLVGLAKRNLKPVVPGFDQLR